MRNAPTRTAALLLGLLLPLVALAVSTPSSRSAAPDRSSARAPRSAAPLPAKIAPGDAPVVAFTHVNVVPMDAERLLEDRTVMVRGERIAAIRPADAAEPPEDAVVVDGRGRYLMPGLGEMHAHVPSGQGGREFMERVLFLYLANGITTIRGMLGAPVHLEVRESIREGELLAPRFYTSGPSLNGSSIPDPDSARRAVLHQERAGYDFIKIHPGLTRAAYDTMAATAHRAGIRFAGHVPAAVGLDRALAAGQATVDHLDNYAETLVRDDADVDGLEPAIFGFHLTDRLDASKIAAVAEATREAGTWNVPTQTLLVNMLAPDDPATLAERPEMRYMPPQTVESWKRAKQGFREHPAYSPEAARRYLAFRRSVIHGLHEAGAGLLLGSDAPQIFQVPGFSIRAELRELVRSGLSPYEALVTGTRNVAEYFGETDRYGTIAEGRIADLVLVEANPLDDVDNAFRRAGVMVRGRWLPEAEIQQRLDGIAAAYRSTE